MNMFLNQLTQKNTTTENGANVKSASSNLARCTKEFNHIFELSKEIKCYNK
jgi:hypothetical protein